MQHKVAAKQRERTAHNHRHGRERAGLLLLASLLLLLGRALSLRWLGLRLGAGLGRVLARGHGRRRQRARVREHVAAIGRGRREGFPADGGGDVGVVGRTVEGGREVAFWLGALGVGEVFQDGLLVFGRMHGDALVKGVVFLLVDGVHARVRVVGGSQGRAVAAVVLAKASDLLDYAFLSRIYPLEGWVVEVGLREGGGVLFLQPRSDG